MSKSRKNFLEQNTQKKMRKKKQFRKKKKKGKTEKSNWGMLRKRSWKNSDQKYIYIYYMLREGNQSLFPSHSHLLQVKAVKAAWQFFSGYPGGSPGTTFCYYCQWRTAVKNFCEQWRYMDTEMTTKIDRTEDCDWLKYYSALTVYLFNFQQLLDSRPKWQ